MADPVNSPGHTDMMGAPETLDAWLAENPLPKSHAPVTTLEELDSLDETELIDGYCSTERDDPEPGLNRSRAFHHGWRTRMMDLKEIETPQEHRQLVRAWLQREAGKRK